MGLTFIPGGTVSVDNPIKKLKANAGNRYYGTYMVKVGSNPLTESLSLGGGDIGSQMFVMNPGDICEFKSIEPVTIGPTETGWVYTTEKAAQVGLINLDPRRPSQIATPLIWRMANVGNNPVIITKGDKLVYLGIFTP